jgi:DNA repair protein RecO (recombination protein O)
MPLHTADALVLRTYKLGEADRIVVFLTEDRGKKRGVAKGARRPRSRFLGALEPLTRVTLTYFERERRELVSLNYAEPLRSPLSAIDPAGLGYAGYFAELIDEWAAENDPDERLYRLGASTVEALAAGAPVETLARYFEYWLLRLQGVYPSFTKCRVCSEDFAGRGAWMPAGERNFVCRRCAPGRSGLAVSSEGIAFLKSATRTSPARLDRVQLTAAAVRELAAAHHALIALHLEKELKSARVVRELYAQA